MTLYALQIADLFNWRGDRAALLKYCLVHDIEETITGVDIPGPAKSQFVDREKYDAFAAEWNLKRFGSWVMDTPTEDIKKIVKAADMLDWMFYLCTEKQMGNRAMDDLLEAAYDRVNRAWQNLPFNPLTLTETYDKLIKSAIQQHAFGQSRTLK